MFFRRKENTRKTPIKGQDGYYYIEEGVDYNSDEYETDSDYSEDDAYTNGVIVEREDVLVVESKDDGHSCNYDTNKENETEVHCLSSNGEEQVNDDPSTTTGSFTHASQETITLNEATECVQLEPNYGDEGVHDASITTTMMEKRSLVYLAAQHDRVDIIKSILQPSDDSDASLIPRILNNKYMADVKEGEDVFLPPLHVAIASSSVNVATCLLRMGANPSVRPNIPEDWNGPDDCIDENGNPPFQGVDLKSLYNGKSAWEIAFPVSSEDSEKQKPATGWFLSWSSSTKMDDSSNRASNSIVDPSKRDGIRHAFTAETLRAIGSDEVKRLEELVDSGIGPRFTIAGKDILTWTMEMGANECYTFLTSKLDDNGGMEEGSNSDSKASTHSNDRSFGSSTNTSNFLEKQGIVFNNETLLMLRNKIEESESLNQALSTMRDNMADELSITGGILMQQNGHSNDILLSHVRMLKQKRAELDDEITEWESRIIDISYELDSIIGLWTNIGGLLEDAFTTGESNSSASLTPSQDYSEEEIKVQIEDSVKKFNNSQKRVKLLRETIAEMAVENSKNIVKVEEFGLQGAVTLARKLKEEIREQELVLQAAKMRANDLSEQVNQVRANLEKRKNLELRVDPKNNEPSGDDRVNDEKTTNIEDAVISDDGSSKESDVKSGEISDYISDVSPLDHVDVEDSSSSSSESNGEESFEEIPGRISHSEAIRQGLSTDVTSYQENERFFGTRVWDLIKRIIGLGKAAAQSAVEDVVNLPRVMII